MPVPRFTKKEIERMRRQHLNTAAPIEHTTKAPVFIIGQARSGTTIIGNMIRKYLGINFGPESQFFFRVKRDIDSYGDLAATKNFRSLIADLSKERCFNLNQFGYEIDIDQVTTNATRSYTGAIDYIYNDFATHNRMTRWGDKTPDYIEHLEELENMFDQAQYIHVVRDGRDVALSNFDVFFGAKNAVVAAKEWKRLIDKTVLFFGSVNKDRFLQIRYEDFLTDPDPTFIRLIEFLKIEDRGGELKHRIQGQISDELRSTNLNKWKTGLTTRQKQDFLRVAGGHLHRLGYETFEEELEPMTMRESFYWQIDHIIRKYSNREVWADNVYKLGLKAQSVKRRLAKPTRSHSS